MFYLICMYFKMKLYKNLLAEKALTVTYSLKSYFDLCCVVVTPLYIVTLYK